LYTNQLNKQLFFGILRFMNLLEIKTNNTDSVSKRGVCYKDIILHRILLLLLLELNYFESL